MIHSPYTWIRNSVDKAYISIIAAGIKKENNYFKLDANVYNIYFFMLYSTQTMPICFAMRE